MKILSFGSLNCDYVYSTDHFVAPGETISALRRETFCGGKGLNQSISLARAGANVFHAGCVGDDGDMLTDALSAAGVDIHLVKKVDAPSGHAIIEVDPSGKNRIIIYGGANRCMTEEYIDSVLSEFSEGDFIVLQNEINDINLIMKKAKAKKMKVVLNPSPIDEALKTVDTYLVDYMLLNETEGFDMTGKTDPDEIISELERKAPEISTVLTLGDKGARYSGKDGKHSFGIFHVHAVDTTAAGDTFTGFFISSVASGKTAEEALRTASAASAIAVTRKGASPSIPTMDEVTEFLKNN